ncbi:HAD family hydrolase [Rhodococcus sp. 27YEA15]|uniref:HAD family hydrolase n=1 Tax=Rhodococcus sp. 27YEA15 TaxID=3156259 RepID=UPI003C7CACB5
MIYSSGSMGPPPHTSPVCVEHYNGGPLSFMAVDAVDLLTDLATRVPVVPVTTRTIAQFQRIDLPGAPWRYAITSNGGNVLVDGVPDAQWRKVIERKSNAGAATLAAIEAELRSRISDSWVSSLRVADELFAYLVVDLDAMPTQFFGQWRQWCAEREWNVSRQGRKIYTMPDSVSKSQALAYVRGRMIEAGELASDATVLAAGDGALDADLLEYADAGIRPRHGELEELDWNRPTVTVTGASGIAASTEILSWFCAQTDAASALDRRESEQILE